MTTNPCPIRVLHQEHHWDPALGRYRCEGVDRGTVPASRVRNQYQRTQGSTDRRR